MNTFGQQVRDRRIQEGLSQETLAQQVGISRNYLSQIERGQAMNLSWQVRDRLSSLLGLQAEPVSDPPDTAEIPPSLAVQMLARLKYRGKQPSTPEKWELLYNVIQMTVGK